MVEMFLDEARLAAKLNHPSIVHVYDVAEADGVKFIAMEHIHGETLTDIIRRGVAVSETTCRSSTGCTSSVRRPPGWPTRTGASTPTARPLRIVHRDVSPSNILVSYEGQTKIVDFGIARIQDQIREESGMRPGKASYMSPEQVAGEGADYRSDIFSLGIILYEISLGQRLWRGPADEVMRRIVEEKIAPPTSVRRDYPPAPGADRHARAGEAACRSLPVGRGDAKRPRGVPRRVGVPHRARGAWRSTSAAVRARRAGHRGGRGPGAAAGRGRFGAEASSRPTSPRS